MSLRIYKDILLPDWVPSWVSQCPPGATLSDGSGLSSRGVLELPISQRHLHLRDDKITTLGDGVVSFRGGLTLETPNLESLGSLESVYGTLFIKGAHKLKSLDNLRTVHGTLCIAGAESLSNLSVHRVNELELSRCPALTALPEGMVIGGPGGLLCPRISLIDTGVASLRGLVDTHRCRLHVKGSPLLAVDYKMSCSTFQQQERDGKWAHRDISYGTFRRKRSAMLSAMRKDAGHAAIVIMSTKLDWEYQLARAFLAGLIT